MNEEAAASIMYAAVVKNWTDRRLGPPQITGMDMIAAYRALLAVAEVKAKENGTKGSNQLTGDKK